MFPTSVFICKCPIVYFVNCSHNLVVPSFILKEKRRKIGLKNKITKNFSPQGFIHYSYIINHTLFYLVPIMSLLLPKTNYFTLKFLTTQNIINK